MNMLKVSWIISIITLAISLYVTQGIDSGLLLPIHWGIEGKPDRFADASQVLLMLPVVLMAVLALLSSLKYIDPRKDNIAMSHKSINAFSLAFTAFAVAMEAGYIAIVKGIEVNMTLIVIFSVGALFVVIGNYLSKTRSNFFIGIKTPWTLSSDAVWKKTHSLAGKLFIISGGVITVSCWFVTNQALGYLVLFTVLPAALIPVVYSWWLWHQEQNEKTT